MSEWAVIAASVSAVAATLFAGHKWLVKAYLKELLPNGGKTMADRVRRIEDNQVRIHERIDAIWEKLGS